jgi:hypothetical protein
MLALTQHRLPESLRTRHLYQVLLRVLANFATALLQISISYAIIVVSVYTLGWLLRALFTGELPNWAWTWRLLVDASEHWFVVFGAVPRCWDTIVRSPYADQEATYQLFSGDPTLFIPTMETAWDIWEMLTVNATKLITVEIGGVRMPIGDVREYIDTQAFWCGYATILWVLLMGVSTFVLHLGLWLVSFCYEHHAIANPRYDALVRTFRTTIFRTPAPIPGHSHGANAALRNRAEEYCSMLASSGGSVEYAIQPSWRIVKNRVPHILVHHSARDLRVPEHEDLLAALHVNTMVNVDYYINMNEFLAHTGLPLVLFTFSPLSPSGSDEESCWFPEDGKMVYRVNGGADYRHELWNFSPDLISVRDGRYYRTYRLERKRVDSKWMFVLFVPTAVSTTATAPQLERVRMSQRGVNGEGKVVTSTIWEHSNGDRYISGDNSPVETRISAACYSGLLARYTAGSLTRANISANLSSYTDLQLGQHHQQIIATYFTVTPGSIFRTFSAPIPQSKHEIWIPTGELDHKTVNFAENKLFKSPNDNAYIVSPSPGAERVAYEARVLAVNSGLTAIPSSYLYAVNEFIDRIRSLGSNLDPQDPEDIIAAQNRPAQRSRSARVREALDGLYYRSKIYLSTFLKKEAYAEPKDARIITTMPTELTILLSRYTYVYAEVLKRTDWYAFGRNPLEIARALHRKSQPASTFIETDFSRFDGTQSWALWQFKTRILCAIFKPIHHPELLKLLEHEARGISVTKSGMKYNSRGQMNSGSPLTSVMNTSINALIAYISYREMGLSEDAAWESLGLYGGDDGITWDIQATTCMRVATDFGLKLKIQHRPAVSACSFLGRIYFHPKDSPANAADPGRSLNKFVLQLDTTVTQVQWAVNKAEGYLKTDPNTAVLTPLCQAIVRIAGAAKVKATGGVGLPDHAKWWTGASHFGVACEANYPKELIPSVEDTEAYTASALGIEPAAMRLYAARCRGATTWEQLPGPLIARTPPVVPAGMAVGDELGPLKANQVNSTKCSNSSSSHSCGQTPCTTHSSSPATSGMGAGASTNQAPTSAGATSASATQSKPTFQGSTPNFVKPQATPSSAGISRTGTCPSRPNSSASLISCSPAPGKSASSTTAGTSQPLRPAPPKVNGAPSPASKATVTSGTSQDSTSCRSGSASVTVSTNSSSSSAQAARDAASNAPASGPLPGTSASLQTGDALDLFSGAGAGASPVRPPQ